MMARGRKGSKQRSDTLMQDRTHPPLGEVFLQRTAGPYIWVIFVRIGTSPALPGCPLRFESGQADSHLARSALSPLCCSRRRGKASRAELRNLVFHLR